MEKLNDFIQKYWVIIVLASVLVLIVNKNTTENMVCDLNRPQDNYISSKLNHLIKNLELNKKQISILNSLFDTSKFPQNGYNKDNKSMNQFIKTNKLTSRKEDFMRAVNIVLNNNRMWDNIEEYKVTGDSKISQIRHIWLLDNMLSDLMCSLTVKQVYSIKEEIKNIMKDKAMKLCNKQELVDYCATVSKNPIMTQLNNSNLEEEEQEMINGNMKDNKDDGVQISDFKLVSLKKSISNFGDGYYREPLNTTLKEILGQFEEKYSRKLDRFDRDDIRKLTLLYVPVLKVIIDKKMSVGKCSANEKKQIEKDYSNHQELFYLLKHQYKLVSVYDLINTSMETNEDKELAYTCCVNKNNKSNMCYRFGQKNESYPIIYGFNKYGYAKNKPCMLETKKEIFDLQTKSLEVRMSKNKYWNTLSNSVKSKFYINLANIINYFISQRIDNTIKNVGVSTLLNKTQNQNMNLVFPEKLDTVKIVVENVIDDETKKSIDSVQLASTISTIMKLAKQNGLNDNDFDFRAMYVTNNPAAVNKVKFAVLKLIELRRLLIVFNANKSSINSTIAKMLAISPTSHNYHNILLRGGVQPRFHKNIIDYLYKMLIDIKLIKLEPISLGSKPYEVIKYIEKIFPTSKDMDVCSNYKIILQSLRTRRDITPNDYIKYTKDLNKFCDSKDSNTDMDKPILYLDDTGKMIEVKLRNVVDYKNKRVFVLATVNKDGDMEIVNFDKNEKKVKYSDIIFNNKNLILKPGVEKVGDLADIVSIKLDMKENKLFIPTKVVIHRESLEEELDEELPKPEYKTYGKVQSVLGKTKLDTDITDKNKNLLNMIDNYFQFSN